LIVDDDPGFLQLARELLEQEGLRVVGVASTAAEARCSAAELRPDVTLVDVELGEDDGFELARQLADDPRLYPGQLILLSAHSEVDLADLIEASPAVGFLEKPAVSAEAIEMLLRSAGRGRAEPDETLEHRANEHQANEN
jgi:CheY-like chemotaxis protein